MSLVRLENISLAYSGVPILKNINWQINEGESLGLIGSNGTGKTSLFKIITGEIEPTSGIVHKKRNIQLSYLKQETEVNDKIALFEAMQRPFHKILSIFDQMKSFESKMSQGDFSESEAYKYGSLQEEFEKEGGFTERLYKRRIQARKQR